MEVPSKKARTAFAIRQRSADGHRPEESFLPGGPVLRKVTKRASQIRSPAYNILKPREGRTCAPPSREPSAAEHTIRRRTLLPMYVSPTLSQTWTVDWVHGPQYAFKVSMFMCPAVHIPTRS